MKKIIIYSIVVVFIAGFTSCTGWFDLRPESDTTLEEFWNNENDVKSMVGACYRAMNEAGFIDRLMVWGEIRSDNVLKGLAAGEERNVDVTRILDLMLNSTNPYTSWTEFYQVINYCNTVIRFAPDVVKKDPNFTEAQLNAYLAEVKGIRALCYFTLVRTFRDIPFSTEPFVDDTKSFDLPQSDPDEVIKYLIDDLKAVENDATFEFSDLASDKGRMTRKAIWCLIADMSLWEGEYGDCITYCNKVLNLLTTSMKNRLAIETSPSEYYSRIFVQGNSSESLFELQFDPSLVTGNTAVHTMYSVGEYSGYPQNYTTFDTRHERVASCDFVGKIPLFRAADLRSKDYYMQSGSNGRFPIIKYVGVRDTRIEKPTASAYTSIPLRSWIFYRLPDVYLMKAEALVESGGDLTEALNCVSKTYDRANPDLDENSLAASSWTRESMRELVFDERQREFLFEGKRYFDLLRRVKRENSTDNVLSLLIRKYESDGMNANTVRGKINDVNALYMPINETELKVNPLLKQNPFYVSTSIINN